MQTTQTSDTQVPENMQFLVPFIAECIRNEQLGGWSADAEHIARSIVTTLVKHGLEILDRSEIESLIAKIDKAQETRGTSEVSNDVYDALRDAKTYLEGLLPKNS